MIEILIMMIPSIAVIIIMIILINLFDTPRKFELNKIIINSDNKSEHYLENGKIIDIKDSEKNGKEILIEYKDKTIEIYTIEYALNYFTLIKRK